MTYNPFNNFIVSLYFFLKIYRLKFYTWKFTHTYCLSVNSAKVGSHNETTQVIDRNRWHMYSAFSDIHKPWSREAIRLYREVVSCLSQAHSCEEDIQVIENEIRNFHLFSSQCYLRAFIFLAVDFFRIRTTAL